MQVNRGRIQEQDLGRIANERTVTRVTSSEVTAAVTVRIWESERLSSLETTRAGEIEIYRRGDSKRLSRRRRENVDGV